MVAEMTGVDDEEKMDAKLDIASVFHCPFDSGCSGDTRTICPRHNGHHVASVSAGNIQLTSSIYLSCLLRTYFPALP